MKKFFGILMLAVTLLSGITVFGQKTSADKHPGRHGRRHHRRWHRPHRQGRHDTGNKNKH